MKVTMVTNGVEDTFFCATIIVHMLVKQFRGERNTGWAMTFFLFLHCSPNIMQYTSNLCLIGVVILLECNMSRQRSDTLCVVHTVCDMLAIIKVIYDIEMEFVHILYCNK